MARLDDYRAQHIASLADPSLGVRLPTAVAKAIRGYQACQQARVPAPPPQAAARLAIVDHAIDLAEDALSAGRAPAAPTRQRSPPPAPPSRPPSTAPRSPWRSGPPP